MSSYRSELGKTLWLAIPMTAGNLSQMIMGLTDTLMIGRVGVTELAAAALANSILHFIFVIGIGLMAAISILVSHAHGAGDRKEMGELLRRGLWISGVAGYLMFLGLWAGAPLIGYLGQPEQVVSATGSYLWLLAAGLPFGMVTLCFKNFSEAQNVPWPAFWSGLISVVLNVFLNWVWIYGNLGAPELGLEGAGLATLVSRIFGIVLLVVWLRLDKRFRGCWPERWLRPPRFHTVAKVFRLGFPVGMQIFIEVGAFSIASLIMGMIGMVELAAHQIAISCAGTTFMVPLGISFAVVIRIGQALGSGEPERVGKIAYSAIAFVVVLSTVFAGGFLIFSGEIAGFFTSDPSTQLLAAQLIIVAGIFQMVDAIQVTTLGSLRGLKDVKVPTVLLLVVYWMICLPLGAGLALSGWMGAVGVWVGLATGLALAAVALLIRFNYSLRTIQA